MLYRLKTELPLAKALSFSDRKVRYSAAIAFAEANPVIKFVGSDLIAENLSEAVLGQDIDGIGAETAQKVPVVFSAAYTAPQKCPGR